MIDEVKSIKAKAPEWWAEADLKPYGKTKESRNLPKDDANEQGHANRKETNLPLPYLPHLRITRPVFYGHT